MKCLLGSTSVCLYRDSCVGFEWIQALSQSKSCFLSSCNWHVFTFSPHKQNSHHENVTSEIREYLQLRSCCIITLMQSFCFSENYQNSEQTYFSRWKWAIFVFFMDIKFTSEVRDQQLIPVCWGWTLNFKIWSLIILI